MSQKTKSTNRLIGEKAIEKAIEKSKTIWPPTMPELKQIPLAGSINFERATFELSPRHCVYLPSFTPVMIVSYANRDRERVTIKFEDEDLERTVNSNTLGIPRFVSGFNPWKGKSGTQEKYCVYIVDFYDSREKFKTDIAAYFRKPASSRSIRLTISNYHEAYLDSLYVQKKLASGKSTYKVGDTVVLHDYRLRSNTRGWDPQFSYVSY